MRLSEFRPFTTGKFSRFALAALAMSFAPTAVSAQFSGLFSTGVDGAGVKLASGTDTHYQVVENSLAQAFVVFQGSYAVSPTASYIWQDAGGNPGSVTRTFRTTFTLAAGFNPLTATLAGKWSTDNAGLNIILNRVSSGATSGGFGTFTNFLITNGFVVGLNTLDFVVQDQGAPGGFAATDFVGTATASTTPPGTTVPEPSTVVLMAAGLFGVAVVGARRKRSA